MAEHELTRELIQEIVKETVQETLKNSITITTQSNDVWIQTIGIMGAVTGSVIALILSQRQHNQKQEKAQIQFNETEKRTKDLESMKQLELYTTKLTEVSHKFSSSDQQFNDCFVYAKGRLTIMDSIYFLRIKNLVDDTFVNFFEAKFSAGRTYLNWLKFTDITPGSWNNVYDNFNQITEDDIIDFHGAVNIESPFYYYVHKFNEDNKYKPHEDKMDTTTYIPTIDDIYLTQPK